MLPKPPPSREARLSYRRRASWEELPDDVLVGVVLADKYRIDGVLGEGSMGKLFVATDLALERRTAIKIAHVAAQLKGELDRRLLVEARAAARLRGEHVARVLDIGRLPSGAPFVVMELLDGENLEQVLERNGRLQVGEAIGWALEACIGLAEAHALGIVHRDIKPENLFLSRATDGSQVLKVLDFGASAFLDAALHGADGTVIGTPLYLAPERILSPRLRDHRSDIWALGAVLYELIAGKPAFDAPTVKEICELVLKHPAPLLRHAVPVPTDLERVIERCLQKQAARRFPDVAALAMALAPYGPGGAYDLANKARRVLSHSAQNRPSVPPPRSSAPSEPLLLSPKGIEKRAGES